MHHRTTRWHERRRALFIASVRGPLYQVAKELGVTHTHLNYVLRGLRTSAPLDKKVYRAIRRALGPATAAPFHP